jgi:hypothetical protein
MKNCIIIALLVLISNTIYSQDLIVTVDGDSINCKITKLKADNVYFTFKHKDEIRNTLLPMTNVKAYQFDYFETSEVPEGKIVGYKNYQHLRFALNGGYSYHLAKVSEAVQSDLRNYVTDLKSGYNYGGDLTYYFSEQFGAGIKFYQFNSSNSMDIYLEDINGDRRYGKMSDDLSISFIGPAFSIRQLNENNRNAFLMGMSIGYMDYSDNKIVIDKYKMNGNTVGMSLDLGYDIGLSENLSLGFQVSLITGTLFQYEWYDGVTTKTIELEKGEYESLNRIDFSVGLRFGK